MIWLLFAGVVLTAGLAWFIARPLRASAQVVTGLERHELELVRDRLLAQLNELDVESADKGVDAQVAQDEEVRMSAELATVLKTLETSTATTQSSTFDGGGRRVWAVTLAVLLLVVPLVAGGLYSWHNAESLKTLVRVEKDGPEAAQVPPMVLEMVKRLEARLAQQPDDAAGWAKLGLSYANLGRGADAKRAYARAYELAPDNQEVLAQYAWIIYAENPRETNGLALELYKQLNRVDPQHPDALWFLGFAAYEQGDFGKSVKYWEHLVQVLPPTSPAAEHIRSAISEAKAKGAQKK
jgi:cytochrome c-type biogenesis protein CcmH